MHRTFRKSGRLQRGSSFVEGALVLTVVIFTLIGIVDVGHVLITHQALVERVRAGARYAVVNAYDQAAIRNVVLYNTATPAQGSRSLLGLSSEMVQVSLLNNGTPEARVEVRIVDYPFRFLTPLIKGLYRTNRIRISMPVEGMGATS
jgi:Flp pilus assembly protein TadG